MNNDPIEINAIHLVRCTCTRCYRTFADYYEPQPPWGFEGITIGSTENYWLEQRGGCVCEPPPALPDEAELERLVARARNKGRPERHRA